MKIDIINKYSNKLIGTTSLSLSDFLDQQKTEKLLYLKPAFDLKLSQSKDLNKSTFSDLGIDMNNMIISVRVRFFWSKKNFFISQIDSTQEILKDNEKEFEYLNKLMSKLKSPFSLVIYGYLDEIKENDLLEIPKAKEDILEKKRLTILPKKYISNPIIANNKCFTYANNIDRAVSRTINTDVEWTGVSIILISILILLSLVQMFERPDFLGLIVSIIIYYYSSNWSNIPFYQIIERIKIIIKVLVIGFSYDLLWLIFNFSVSFNIIVNIGILVIQQVRHTKQVSN